MSQWWVDAIKTGKLMCSRCEETKSMHKDFTKSLYYCDACLEKIKKEDL